MRINHSFNIGDQLELFFHSVQVVGYYNNGTITDTPSDFLSVIQRVLINRETKTTQVAFTQVVVHHSVLQPNQYAPAAKLTELNGN